tara:strand:+ start:287 stop:535 length:249 start_codon:yes stop_codon:yes gene_type:complete
MDLCSSCQIEAKTKLAVAPFTAYEVGLCDTCFAQHLYPHWLILSAVDSAGGYDSCSAWFREIIDKNLEYRGISVEEFRDETK